MSVTILEALQGAEMNLKTAERDALMGPVGEMAFELAKGQLHNIIGLLEKGYSVYEKVEPLLEQYGKVEMVPDKD